MRLLSTKELEVVSIREDEIPPYAILSHTWDKDELTLQEMQGSIGEMLSLSPVHNNHMPKKGIQKVLGAMKVAASEGYDWIWIDSCCIDKSSSAELSEAINSMYRWYQGSEICYVYLADAIMDIKELRKSCDDPLGKLIRDSRWITRGWTLQELIAPSSVSFYSSDWSFMGKSTDDHIMRHLAEGTGVDIGVLSGDITTQEVSVANRMRWASKRKTTRQEDMAYSLMGLFGVNMPLLYGEGGARSFIRLQVEILRATDDQTIFAWSAPLGSKGHGGASGLLAESPAYFQDVPNMYLTSDWHQSESSTPWSMTNMGLMVQLYLQSSRSGDSRKEDSANEFVAVLNCSAETERLDDCGREWTDEYTPTISLRRLWGDQFARMHDEGRCVRLHDRKGGQVKTIFVKQDQSLSLPSFTIPEKFLRRTGSLIVSEVYPRELWDSKSGIFRSGPSRQRCIQGLFRFSDPSQGGIIDGVFDVAVALESTAPGQFKAVGILRPPWGRTLRQAYDAINKIWLRASPGQRRTLEKEPLEYRHQKIASLKLRRTQSHGGISYVLDLLTKVAVNVTISNPHRDAAAVSTMERLKLFKAPISAERAERQLKLLFKPICVSDTSQPGQLIALDDRIRVRRRKKLLSERQGTEMLKSLTMNGSSESCKSAFHETNCDTPNTEDEVCSVCSQLVAELAKENQINLIVQEVGSVHIDKRVRYGICEDWLVHLTALRCGPLFSSWLREQCVEFKADIFKGSCIMSILSNALGLRELLEKLESKTDFSDLPSIREQLGAVKGTQDTALHLAATYSTMEEFEHVMTILTPVEEGLEPSDDFDIKCKWSYLFRLQNGNRETVLHRAAAMSNIGVVSFICEQAPEVARELDLMNRSTLWHAACGGDHRIISIIGTALKSLKWAPTVDYPDDNGLTPLHVACREGYGDCVKALLDLGASPRCAAQSSGLTPIHYASLFGHLRCLETMAQHPHARSDFSEAVRMADDVDLIRPIHLAAANGWHECNQLLIKHGSPLKPLASLMCIARDSPSWQHFVRIDDSRPDSTEGTDVQVETIEMSTPKEVAAKQGWDRVVSILKDEEELLLGRSSAM